MKIAALNELDAERTIIGVLLQGQEQQRDQLDTTYQGARRALDAQIDGLRQRRDWVNQQLLSTAQVA